MGIETDIIHISKPSKTLKSYWTEVEEMRKEKYQRQPWPETLLKTYHSLYDPKGNKFDNKHQTILRIFLLSDC